MNNKKLKSMFLIIFFLIVILTGKSLAINPDDFNPEAKIETGEIITKAGQILGWIQFLGIIIAVITLTIIGLKYLLSSVEGKAEYKKTALAYIVGCFLLMSVSLIIGFIGNIVSTDTTTARSETQGQIDKTKQGQTGKTTQGQTSGQTQGQTGGTTQGQTSGQTQSQDGGTTQKKSDITKSTMDQRSYDGKKFWLYTPENITENMPVILFLVGSGENGKDLDYIKNNVAICKNLYNKKIGTDAIIIIQNTYDYAATTKILEGLESGTIKDSNGRKILINKERLALIGFSAGANRILSNSEDIANKFKVAVVISGQTNSKAEKLNGLNAVRTYAGTKETEYLPKMKSLADKINKNGGNAEFISYNATHSTILGQVFEDSSVFDWILSNM